MRMRKGKWSESLVGIPRKIAANENRGYVARFRIRDNGTVHAFPLSGPFFHGCFLSIPTPFDVGRNARGRNVFHHRDFESIPMISSPLSPHFLAIFSSSSSIFETLSSLLSYLFSIVLRLQASILFYFCFDIIVNLLRGRFSFSLRKFPFSLHQ